MKLGTMIVVVLGLEICCLALAILILFQNPTPATLQQGDSVLTLSSWEMKTIYALAVLGIPNLCFLIWIAFIGIIEFLFFRKDPKHHLTQGD